MDFRTEIRKIASLAQNVLELGPSYNPILPKSEGFHVKSVDHATQEQLIDKYSAYNIDTTKIEPVDFVTTDLSSISPSECFDTILASHVIEHTTDLLKFLQDCSRLLPENGRLVLLVPDKRYCFDLHRPLSTTGAVIDAFLSRRRQHRGAVFDHYANFAQRNGAMAWGEQEKSSVSIVHSSVENTAALEKSINASEYMDAHEWVFTPRSFQLIIQDLNDCGLTDLALENQYDTHGYEFFVTLTRSPSAKRVDRKELLNAIGFEQLKTYLEILPQEVLTQHLAHFMPMQDIHALERRVQMLINENCALQNENETLKKNIGNLYDSSSWKITSPLRRAKLLFAGVRTG